MSEDKNFYSTAPDDEVCRGEETPVEVSYRLELSKYVDEISNDVIALAWKVEREAPECFRKEVFETVTQHCFNINS